MRFILNWMNFRFTFNKPNQNKVRLVKTKPVTAARTRWTWGFLQKCLAASQRPGSTLSMLNLMPPCPGASADDPIECGQAAFQCSGAVEGAGLRLRPAGFWLHERQTNERQRKVRPGPSGSGLSVSGPGIRVRVAHHWDGVMNTQEPELMWGSNPKHYTTEVKRCRERAFCSRKANEVKLM